MFIGLSMTVRGKIMKQKITKLIDVKSIVTLLLTVVFCVLSVRQNISAEQFLTIFTTVIALYFGKQYSKKDGDDK